MRETVETLSFQRLPGHDGIPLACDGRGGDGPLAVFIHGWTCRRAYWLPQLEYFGVSQAVVAPDLPGHGDSSPGERTEWTLRAFARDVEAVVDALNGQQVVLIGHSMGGAVALECARSLGPRVAGVVLVDTFVIDYGGLSPDAATALYAPFEDDFAAAMAGLVAHTCTAATPPELVSRLIREMSGADPAWALPALHDLLHWSPLPAFAELQVPVHAINGALIPPSARQRCAPYVHETLVPGAGHFLQMEDPERFNRLLQRVLRALA